MNREPVRVLVVDDSALMRKLIPQILEQDPSVKVVGTAIDGYFALKRIPELHPDVITLDMEMPGMSGAEVLSQITRIHHIPVIVVSSHTTQGASATFKAGLILRFVIGCPLESSVVTLTIIPFSSTSRFAANQRACVSHSRARTDASPSVRLPRSSNIGNRRFHSLRAAEPRCFGINGTLDGSDGACCAAISAP